MRKRYRFTELSQQEKDLHENLLLQEVDIQAWYTISYLDLFGGELYLSVQ